jgi:hypothetical protein
LALPPNSDPNRPDKSADRAAAEQEVLLREIDDAVRQDQLAGAARRYGRPVLAFVIAGLAAFAGYLWWHERQEAQLEAASEGLVRALDQFDAGNFAPGEAALAPVAQSGSEGAKAASQLLKAGLALQQARKDEAIRLYAAVAADNGAPKPYRDLASIREVAANFDAMKPEDVVSRLKPLAVPGNPWFGSAGELVGIAYLKQGRTELAGPLFAAIAKSEDVPETLRSRARQMSGLLGVDAVVDVDAAVGNVTLADDPADAATKP